MVDAPVEVEVSSLKTDGLVLSKKILAAHPNGFVGALIVGKRGIGKSTYGLIVLHEIYIKLGYTENQAWREALNRCLFHLKDVIDFLEQSALSDDKEIALLWDDTGIYASGMSYFSNFKMVERLKSVLDVVRSSLSGLIMTTPSQSGILGFLNQYDDYLVTIKYARSGYDRIATGYIRRTLPSGKRLVYKRYVDYYSCYIPKWVYDLYNQKRKQCYSELLKQLKESVVE